MLHLPDRPSTSAVVCCHGLLADKNGPKQRFLASELCRRGHLALRFDFTGRGESAGDLLELTLARQVEDCRAALELLKARGARTLGLFGSSFGGSTAIMVAAQNTIAALVTLAAPARTRRLFSRHAGPQGLEKWQQKGSIQFDGVPIGYSVYREALAMEPLAAARNISCPWLILHGELDETVPVEDATLLGRECRSARFERLPGADHRLSDQAVMRKAMLLAADFLDLELKGKLK